MFFLFAFHVSGLNWSNSNLVGSAGQLFSQFARSLRNPDVSKPNTPTANRATVEGSGAGTRVGEKTGVLSLASTAPTYANDSPDGEVVIAVGVSGLKKLKVPVWPGASAVPELFCQMMELPAKSLSQPSEFVAVLGLDGRLSPLNVQPYQKPLISVVPLFCSNMV